MPDTHPSHLIAVQYARLHGKPQSAVSLYIKQGRIRTEVIFGTPMIPYDTPWPARNVRTSSDVYARRRELAVTLRAKGYTLQFIGDVLGVCRERVRQILKGASK